MPLEKDDENLGSMLLGTCTNCFTFTSPDKKTTENINKKHKKKDIDPAKQDINIYCVVGILLFLFVLSGTGFTLMWCTDFYNNILVSKLVLARNSENAKNWINPNPKFDTLLKVHLFNYTNVDRFLSGLDNKFKVEDIGPLTYKEHTVKVEVSFNDNFTVSFRDKKSFEFLPELSTHNEDIQLIVPNVPLLTAVSEVENLRSDTIFHSGVKNFKKIFLRSIDTNIFKSLNAREFQWGYKDKVAALGGNQYFGIFINRNGVSVDSLQFNTGEDDLHKYSIITQFNGQPVLNFWEGDYCNQIDGSDATRFPPHLLKTRENLHVFLQVLCRKIPLKYEREVLLYENIPALRYLTPNDIFAHPSINSKNACFCKNTKTCLPSGIINATLCYNGAPIYPSLPHFYTADPIMYDYIEGLHPRAAIHRTYADIHPRFAFPIGGASRIQINIRLDKSNVYPANQIKYVKDTLYLPLCWIEITSGEITPDMLDDLYLSTVGLDATEKALKYGTIFTCLLCLVALALALLYFYIVYQEHVLDYVLRNSQIAVTYPRANLENMTTTRA